MSLGLGRIQKDDPRDLNHTIRGFLSEEIRIQEPIIDQPYHYNWIPWKLFPMNQGTYPHCVGYATKGLLYAGPIVNMHGPDPVLIYREAQKRDEIPGENYAGTTARGAMEFLRERGLIERYVWAWDVPTIRLWHLGYRMPGLLGINWYRSFNEPTKEGFITLPPTARLDGGHEVLSLGWNDHRGALRCMNSWGRWGQAGRFWISGELLERLMNERGDFVSPTEIRLLQPRELLRAA